MSQGPATDRDNRPIPDPTTLTTDALEREIGHLRELLSAQVEHVDELVNEKNERVLNRFELIERQRVEQKNDTEKAVAAALSAAKEAVSEQTQASERAINKSEDATTKSIDGLGEKFDTAIQALQREIGDIKGRITVIEARKEGGKESIGQVLAMAAVAVSILALIAVVALR